MKKVLVIQLFLVSALLGAQNFDSVVDFDTRLSDLSDQASVERVVADSRVLILEGILGDRVRDAGGGDSWIDLLGGEWIGTERLLSPTPAIFVLTAIDGPTPFLRSGRTNPTGISCRQAVGCWPLWILPDGMP